MCDQVHLTFHDFTKDDLDYLRFNNNTLRALCGKRKTVKHFKGQVNCPECIQIAEKEKRSLRLPDE